MSTSASVLLVGAEDEENLAIRSLAAFLHQHGVEAAVTGFSTPADTSEVLKQIVQRRPGVLAISMPFQCRAMVGFEMLARVRSAGFRGHIVLGGHFPTFEYQTILQTQLAIDSIIRFEGEHGIVQLAEAIGSGGGLETVPNLVWRTADGLAENPCTHGFMDLDSLPFPLRSDRAQRRLGERFASLVSSRGCWHSSCIYCCIGAFHRPKGAKFALRSAASVAREIARLHLDKGVNLLQFHDDNFVLATPAATCERLVDLRSEIERQGIAIAKIAFLIKARPDVVDESVADALAELGCVGVFLGVENATESGLRALCRGADLAALERALDCLERRRISITYNLLVFHPHATIDEIRANVAFVRRHPRLPFDFGRAEIVAGSPLEQLVLNEGTRCGRWPQWDYRLADPAVQRAFDLNRVTFRAPGGGYSSLMHTLIALRYHAATARRLHPGRSADAIESAAADLIEQANLFVLDRIDELLAMAETGAAVSSPAAVELRERLDARCYDLLRSARALTQELHRLQTAERIFSWFGVREMLQGMKLAGVLGIRN